MTRILTYVEYPNFYYCHQIQMRTVRLQLCSTPYSGGHQPGYSNSINFLSLSHFQNYFGWFYEEKRDTLCFTCQYINGFEQLYETFNKIDSALIIKQNLLIFKIFHRHSWGWLDDVWYNAWQNHYLLINWSIPQQSIIFRAVLVNICACSLWNNMRDFCCSISDITSHTFLIILFWLWVAGEQYGNYIAEKS